MANLVIAEHDGQALSQHTGKVLNAVRKLDGEVDILILGHQLQDIAPSAAQYAGVRQVLVADDAALQHQLAEPVADAIVALADGYDVIAAAATTTGKSIMPRVAALLDVMQISEVVEIVSHDCFKRPIYAGNAIETVQSTDTKKILTVRTASFDPAELGGNAPIEQVAPSSNSAISVFIQDEAQKAERPELTSANIVVSGGRALGSKEKFDEIVVSLADRLGAAVGASRAAVDAGHAPNDWQVGQTGKIVAPDLYLGLGISGAIQHVAGIQDAKIIVAINSDEEAPLMQMADYALVGDLFEIVPELMAAL